MRRYFQFLLLAVLGVSGFTGCSEKAAPASDLKVLFTCDTRGRLVPCGCFTGQHGGMTRLKTALEKMDSPDAIRVDVGDAIRGTADFNLIEYKYILEAYAGMKFDALNLGHREAGLGIEQLIDLGKTSPVSLISANLFDEKSRTPLFEPYKIVQRGRDRVALIGLMDPRGMNEQLGAGVIVEKMETVLSRLLPEVKKKADIIVLLAFADEAAMAQLADEFYELDLILGGNVSQSAQNLEKRNRSYIYYTANESRTLGLFHGTIEGPSKLSARSSEIFLLHDKIQEHPAIVASAAQYRKEIRGAKLQIDDPLRLQEDFIPGVKTAATYVGSESCRSCHETETRIWEKTGHAHAFETLIARDANADPNCIACHTVGFGTPSGYQRKFENKKLVDVGCESCHGPGSLHVDQYRAGGAVTFKFRPLGAGDCQKCHYGEFSRPFNWDEFWPLIEHGKLTKAKK